VSGASWRSLVGAARRAPAPVSGFLPTTVPPESLALVESATPTATELGAIDAAAGVPDPLAESSDDRRQPVATLELMNAESVQAVRRAFAAGLDQLGEIARLDLVIPGLMRGLRENLHAWEDRLQQTSAARERHLAHWRCTALVLAIALALPFEVYLTSLSLSFLDVADVWAVRLLSLGIALSLTLTGLIAAQLGRDARWHGWRNAALWFLVLLVLALAMLRYGVMAHNNALWEQAGALVALAASAAAFALWVGFVDSRIHRAQLEQERWEARSEIEHELRAGRAQLALLEERLVGLPAEVPSVRDAAVAEIEQQAGAFDLNSNLWWASNQQSNPAAAPDIRLQRQRLEQKLEQVVNESMQKVDDRAATLAATIAANPPFSWET
jgi:hypothetical protein